MGDEGIPFRDIAGIIGRRLNLPVVSIPREKAMKHFEWLGGLRPDGRSRLLQPHP